MMKSKFKLLYFILFFLPIKLFSGDNFVELSSDKLAGTYYFSLNSMIKDTSSLGIFSINQRYNGVGFQNQDYPFKDDEELLFNYQYPLNDNFSLLFRNKTILFYEAFDFEKFDFLAGVQYRIDDILNIDFYSGFKKDIEYSYDWEGQKYLLEAYLNEVDLSGYKLKSKVLLDYSKLNPEIENSDPKRDIVFHLDQSIRNDFDNDNSLEFSYYYKNFDQDNINTLIINEAEFIPLEKRLKDEYAVNFNTKFLISNFKNYLNIDLGNSNVSRYYNNFLESISETGISRDYDNFLLSFDFASEYNTDNFLQRIRFSYKSVTEDNEVKEKYDIDDEEFQYFRLLENRKDKQNKVTSLRSNTKYLFSESDTLSLDMYVSIDRMDTPSEQNYFDRDELRTFIDFSYKHRFSDITSISLNLKTKLSHDVNLKKEMSSQNKWNRAIIFSPTVYINTKSLLMSPKMEIKAIYEVYDYVGKVSGINSYSFRQISYKDNIIINLSEDFRIDNKLNLSYYENGLLFWNEFAETPRNSSYEAFVKSILFYKANEISRIGIGIRYYELERKNLQKNLAASSDINSYSISPELDIIFSVSKSFKLKLSGWYESIFEKNKYNRSVANLYLTSRYNL